MNSPLQTALVLQGPDATVPTIHWRLGKRVPIFVRALDSVRQGSGGGLAGLAIGVFLLSISVADSTQEVSS